MKKSRVQIQDHSMSNWDFPYTIIILAQLSSAKPLFYTEYNIKLFSINQAF
jgi:hypothetical protein